MTLQEFLKSGAMTAEVLAEKAGVKNPDQIRQWAFYGRKPGAAYAMAIESATGKTVRRWDLRPTDWHLIWPELKKSKDAPAIPAQSAQEA